MTRFRKAGLILLGSLVLTSSWAAAQTEEANNILGQAGPSVLALVSYGSDKAEIIKGSALALSEDILVTAYHVVSQASDVEGLNIKGKKVKLDGILGVDKAHDIALLKLKGQAPGPARRLHRQPDRGRPPLRAGLQRIWARWSSPRAPSAGPWISAPRARSSRSRCPARTSSAAGRSSTSTASSSAWCSSATGTSSSACPSPASSACPGRGKSPSSSP